MLSISKKPYLGLYEKALPTSMSIKEKVSKAKELGFDFIELSIDEQDFRLDRLKWTTEERIDLISYLREQNMRIPSICLSAHRRFPLGSKDPKVRERALEILKDAIDFADDIGVRVIQLAGYDVYYEAKSLETRALFIENLRLGMAWAVQKQVTLSIEIMDDPFINSLTKFLEIQKEVNDTNLKAYVDVGNLSAWPENNVGYELTKGIKDTIAIHLKDTLFVSNEFKGQFKNVKFGEGNVDFPGCIRSLKLNNYRGPFLIEMWTKEDLSLDEENIREAKDFICKAFEEGGWFNG